MKTLLLPALSLLLGVSAFAHDSAHLVCTGFVGQSSDRYGIAIQFDETRAADGMTRDERLSSVWAGDLYQGIRNNKSADMGHNGRIVMALPNAPQNVFFKGAYELVPNGTENYNLRINGELNLVPSASGTRQPVSTTLTCVNLTT